MTATATKAGRKHSSPGQPVPPIPRRRPFHPSLGMPPEVGPFGLAVQDPDTGRWKRSLTPEGWAELDRWMTSAERIDRRTGTRDLVGLLVFTHPLVHKAAKAAGMTREDVYQWCYIGAVRAMQTFDPARGFQFDTYVTHWMRQMVGRETERMSAHRKHDKRVCSLFAPMPNASGEDDDLSRTLGREDDADPDVTGRREQVRAAIGKAIPDERTRAMVAARYGLDGRGEKTLDEVGKMFGVCRERVRQLMAKADERLRRYLWPVVNRG